MSILQNQKGIRFDKALDKTVFSRSYRDRHPFVKYRFSKKIFCGCRFQVLILLLTILISNETVPIEYGLNFLEIEPKYWEC